GRGRNRGRVGGRVVGRIHFSAAGHSDAIGAAGGGVRRHTHGQSNRRIAGVSRDRVGAGTRQSAEGAGPTCAADGGRGELGGQDIDDGDGAGGGGETAVGHDERVGRPGLA